MSLHDRKNIDWDEYHQQNKQPNKVRKGAKIRKLRNRYNLTQDTNGKVTNSPLDITNERQEIMPFLGINKQKRMKAYQTKDRNTINDPQKKYRIGTVS